MTADTTSGNPLLDGLLADLAAESDDIDQRLADRDPGQWRTPTPAEGWDVADQIAHLAWTDEAALAAATDPAAWEALVSAALDDPEGFVDRAAHTGAAAAPESLLDRWRTGRTRLAEALAIYPAGEKIPWFGPPMSPASMVTARFMETWAHGLDIADAFGDVPSPTDRIRHVAHLGVRTRDFAFLQRGLPVPTDPIHVELTAPSGAVWTWGEADVSQHVRGPAWDFCLLVTRRRHRDDLSLIATGVDADRWLDIAQAFAGPPGADPQRTGGGR